MQSPFSNPYLSLTARGLFAYYKELGRVVSADEISAAVPEGRDAVRTAMRELKQFGYITAVKQQVNGQWRTHLKFTESAKKWVSTDDGFSGALYIDNTSTSSSTTSDSKANRLKVLRTFNLEGAAPLREGNAMGWNLDGEEDAPKPKRKSIRLDSEDDSGSVGKVVDKKALRAAKYKAAPIDDSLSHRSNKPEQDWTTKDIVAEFYALTEKHAPNVPGQVNADEIAKCVNKYSREGASRLAVLKAIRMFFEDPRNLHNVGVGQPLWRKFMAYYPTVYGVVTKNEVVYADEEFLAHQEKMLKLLGGK
jgi:hypothetical protein